MPDSASGGSIHMASAEATSWMGILVLGAVLIGLLVLLGYGLIGFFMLFLLLSMAGGALLYWRYGEGEN
jgi:hypothetical protein